MSIIFNIQKYSIHDGPGIRSTVFFKGCPLKCKWCHNPESQSFEREIMFYVDRCIGCNYCVNECENGGLYLEDGNIVFDKEKCLGCGKCCEVCPTNAREFIGKHMTTDAVFHEILKDKIFYDESKGGVTFSGGEPLSQGSDLIDIIKKCKERKIHITLDTSGYASEEILKQVCENVDLVLYDLKVIDNEKHKEYIGVDNKIILENLKILVKLNKRVFVRIPLIPGVNTNKKDIEDYIKFLKETGGIEEVDILPYHNISSEKYNRLNKEYELKDVEVPSEKMLDEIKEDFEKNGFKVKIGG
ncbi:trans-4-hydroxy-L-proline dehydratase activase [Clostridium hydrogeniformans]|uniref:trans-4-hydroxy-L-proline dehydratase activase n=1 Tax=Clostridium hydrogeniformans TaxID=349933 RepID=UPI0004841303|nr:trans-4-hydroxy-L-proline dehydratase activase [Clostridium hydrogeniformans]